MTNSQSSTSPLVILSSALLIAASAGPAAAEAMPDSPSGGEPLPTASRTECSLLNTVCSTAVAVATVVCTKPGGGFAQCTGAGTVGGHGASPTKLPGEISWSGSSTCGGDCSGSKSTSGYLTWPGVLGANGNGGQVTLEHSTVAKFLSCVKYSVSASVTATAKSKVLGITVEAKTTSVGESSPVLIQCP